MGRDHRESRGTPAFAERAGAAVGEAFVDRRARGCVGRDPEFATNVDAVNTDRGRWRRALERAGGARAVTSFSLGESVLTQPSTSPESASKGTHIDRVAPSAAAARERVRGTLAVDQFASADHSLPRHCGVRSVVPPREVSELAGMIKEGAELRQAAPGALIVVAAGPIPSRSWARQCPALLAPSPNGIAYFRGDGRPPSASDGRFLPRAARWSIPPLQHRRSRRTVLHIVIAGSGTTTVHIGNAVYLTNHLA